MSGLTLAGSLRSHGLSSSVSGPQFASLALSATPPTYELFSWEVVTLGCLILWSLYPPEVLPNHVPSEGNSTRCDEFLLGVLSSRRQGSLFEIATVFQRRVGI